MKKNYYSTLLAAFLLALYMPAMSQVSFTNSNSKLVTAGFHSGCPVTVTDWNGDGLDDIIRLDQGHNCYVEVQQTNQTYTSIHLGDFGGGAWAMTVADVDKNGYVDVVADGSNGIGLLKTNANGTGATMTWLANSGFFLQNATFGDFNNDGWIDLFACDDNAPSHIYENDGTGNLVPSSIINFDITPGQVIGTSNDDSGNYGSVWTDFDNDGDMDLYIAKCRQSVGSPSDPRRIDVLFVNDGTNNYTNMASTYGVANGWQTWTASFGDLDNDGDLDLVATNHDHESQIFVNDGLGNYTDITAATSFDITDITPIESIIADFDNDGYNDILATGSDSRFYRNNGNMTFTKIEGLFDSNNMESFAVGDINHDGFLDVYASYATIYTNPSNIDDVIWLNDRNSNHFITLSLTGTTSNVDAIGARANVYSSLGVQVAEVRAGESYGTCNSTQLHFGLGNLTAVDSIVINWPSGLSQTIPNPDADQFINIVEGQCVSPMGVVSASGPAVLCPGQALILSAPAGANYSYLWSDGSTGQLLLITASGEYSVQITDPGNACVATSPTFTVISNPDQTPTITTSSAILEFCDGGSVDLLAPDGAISYLWSSGETTQTITVTNSGTYSLTIQGFCQTWNSVNSITVTVHTAVPPTANNVVLPAPGTTTLNATGSNIQWYDNITGGNLLGTGNSYNTPFLNTQTTFYVESADVFSKVSPAGIENAANTYSPNGTNGNLLFTVSNDCILNSVKTYTDTPGIRLIELRTQGTNLLVDSESVFISPDSQIVNLNFALTAGTAYIMSTDVAANQAMWGNDGPRLKRNNGGVNYPYTIPGVLSITGSTLGANVYYYFYDWQVYYETRCASARIPVVVDIITGISELNAAGVNVYPNPASDKINISIDNNDEYIISLVDQAGRIVTNETITKSSSISLEGIATGIYNLRMQSDKQMLNCKIVVE